MQDGKTTIDRFYLGSCGCFVGGVLGPLLLFALLGFAESRSPDSGGGPLGYLFVFLVAAILGGGLGAVLFPFIVSKLLSFRKK